MDSRKPFGNDSNSISLSLLWLKGIEYLPVLMFDGSGTPYVPGPTSEEVLASGAVAARTRGALSYILSSIYNVCWLLWRQWSAKGVAGGLHKTRQCLLRMRQGAGPVC